MRKTIIILTLLAVSLPSLRGVDKDSLWRDATNAYTQGDFQQALNGFTEIEKGGYISPELYYNIGNSYYKQSGNLAHAILYYERALKLKPNYKDAQHNLLLAQQFTLDRIDSVPEFVFVTWGRSVRTLMTSDGWALLSLGLLLLLGIFFLLYRYAGSLSAKRGSFIMGLLVLLSFAISLTSSITSYREMKKEDMAIILSPVTSVKSSPNQLGTSLFILHEGTKVELIEHLGEWSRVELSDGRQGWLQMNDMEII